MYRQILYTMLDCIYRIDCIDVIKLATFRIDGDDWQQFQDIARKNNTTASALLVNFVQGVIKGGCIDNKTQVSIQDGDIKDEVVDAYAQVTINLNEALLRTNQKFEEIEERLKKVEYLATQARQREIENKNPPNYDAIRDRVVAGWKIAKRPESKDRIAMAINKFISEIGAV